MEIPQKSQSINFKDKTWLIDQESNITYRMLEKGDLGREYFELLG
jgi:GNAT superfamily N-acetyltransferase